MTCNAEIQFCCAYSNPGANINSPPEYVKICVRGKPPQTWSEELVLPTNRLTAKELRVRCPFLNLGMSDQKATRFLMEQLAEELHVGKIPRGYYFHELGAQWFPDGALRFLRGDKLYPENCPSPYMFTPEIADVQLVGNGNAHPSAIKALLLSAPLEALLAIAYTTLTSVRSLVLGNGIDLQAVLYIEGGSGLGKTTLATRTAGIYRNSRTGKPAGIVQAGSTISATESLLVSLRDQPVVVDDLCLSAGCDTERKRRELGARLIREGTGDAPIIKKTGGNISELYCNAGVVLTAEFTMENPSDLNRCLIIPVHQQLDLPDTLTPELVGDLIRIFSCWFAENHKRALEELRAKLGGNWKQELEPRIRTNYLCLRWAFHSLLSALVDCGVLSSEDCSRGVKRLKAALNLALDEHERLKKSLQDMIPRGNLAAVLYSGYTDNSFSLADKPKKLMECDGIIWKKDLCLRPEALVRFVRLQPGFQAWTRNKVTQELKDLGALVLQEEGTSTVHLKGGLPRVYRIQVDVLRDAAVYF